jgi:hypothetical protein
VDLPPATKAAKGSFEKQLTFGDQGRPAAVSLLMTFGTRTSSQIMAGNLRTTPLRADL